VSLRCLSRLPVNPFHQSIPRSNHPSLFLWQVAGLKHLSSELVLTAPLSKTPTNQSRSVRVFRAFSAGPTFFKIQLFVNTNNFIISFRIKKIFVIYVIYLIFFGRFLFTSQPSKHYLELELQPVVRGCRSFQLL